MSQNNSLVLFPGGDDSSNLANSRFQYIEFYHLISDLSVQFKAFLTEFTDGYGSTWHEEAAYGRMDPISMFVNTKRTVNLGWTVPSAELEEAKTNISKASLLLSMVYPDYEEQQGATTIKTSPLFRLKFMNLIQNIKVPGGTAKISGLLGRVDGFEYGPELHEGFFDPLGLFGQTEIYPQTIKFKCKFTVLHEHPLGWKNGEARIPEFKKFPYNTANSPASTTTPPLGPLAAADPQRSGSPIELIVNDLQKMKTLS